MFTKWQAHHLPEFVEEMEVIWRVTQFAPSCSRLKILDEYKKIATIPFTIKRLIYI